MTLISTSAFRPLRPIDVKYATVPVQQGFNWGECLADFESGVWHLVVFRSVRSETAEDSVLAEFDERFRSIRTELHALLLHLMVYYIVQKAGQGAWRLNLAE